ncbi:DEAD/DEAH box helicase [Leucobacter chinensis]|uniref:DEAD/DEAH box helicase n=1 Tax=Leucobacter chinensis TaxID=2851010 RepID=UPI001C2400CD|nr:DEAD/DEAH box helicase [Leucobacter chinensis]
MTEPLSQDLTEFQERLKYPLDAFQLAACESLDRGKSVLVAAPTGAGKTTIAEFAIWLARGREQGRVFYTAPIKALSNQKFHELRAEYGDDEVGLLTGDTNLRGNAPITVMTTEVLRNMIYEGSKDLDDLAYVILDEVHYLADRFRGAVWEEVILHLPSHVKLVSLSATVSNAEEFGDWLHTVRGNTEVIVSEHRPVPLFQHVMVKDTMYPLFVDRDGELAQRGKLNRELVRMERGSESDRRGGGRGGFTRRNRIQHGRLAHMLDEAKLLPGIVFIFSRKGCDMAVMRCLQDGVRLTTKEERDAIRRIVKHELRGFSRDDLAVLGYNAWLSGLERGVAAHHAGLIPQFKSIVETLFQSRLVKLVFATETLALGINMPAKSVTIEQLDKFNGETRVPLTPGEYTQLTGRAGRRGIDTEGHAIISWESRQDLDVIAGLASKRLYPLKSSFRPTYNMAVNLLERDTVEQVRETLERSFAQFQADKDMVTLAQAAQDQQKSLAGYERAMQRAKGADRERWKRRYAKLKRETDRKVRQVSRRTSTIARVFDRVTLVLESLGYLADTGETLKPTQHGELLRRLYGERDLLVAECLRYGVWNALTPPQLASLAAGVVYEPRREDEGWEPRIPGEALRNAYADTLDHWARLDGLEEQHHLPLKERPHPGLMQAMHVWASGRTMEETLERTHLIPGDMVRVTKQTIDLLDQIAGLDHPLAERAREARNLIDRGIIASSKATA